MQRRALGKTGLEVSEIAFGGVEIGMPYGIGVESSEDMVTEKEAIHLLHASLDAGINFFDTARLYGNSENIMGKAFKNSRDRVVLCTKCAHFPSLDGNLPPGSQLDSMIRDSLEQSLKALQTAYVDVFMLHTASEEVLDNDGIARTFSDLKQSGLARAIGVSTYLPRETEKAIDTGIWDVIQLPFNLLDQRQKAFFSAASQKGIGIVIRSVLMKGLLSERGRNLHPALSAVEEHISSYHTLLGNKAADLPALATRFALSFDEIASVLVGIDRMEYLSESLEAANGLYLDEDSKTNACNLAYPDPEFLNLNTWSKQGWLR